MIKNTCVHLQQISRQYKNPSWAERVERLQALRVLIKQHETQIKSALFEDLKKPAFEVQLTEISPCYQELDHALKHLKSWMRPRKVSPALPLVMASSQVLVEPKGLVLVIAPWNYPFQLALAPVIAALSAGNRVIIKPSELTPKTSKLIAQLFQASGWQDWVAVIEGGVEVSTELMEFPFDHIFFTGSTAVGKLVMQAAAKNLATVTLELGGKSPVIVDQDYDLVTLAKTLAWGKFLNLGQTCVAPDYVWAHQSYQGRLAAEILQQWDKMTLANSAQHTHIINEKHKARLQNYLDQLKSKSAVTIFSSKDTILNVIEGSWQSSLIAQEEIFGPLLPIRYYQDEQEIIDDLNQYPDALSLYIFSNKQNFINNILTHTRSGGVCINDVILHLAHPQLPFGGRGHSGQGAYHGESGFFELSHQRSVMQLPTPGRTWEWLHFFYPPYTAEKIKWLKWL